MTTGHTRAENPSRVTRDEQLLPVAGLAQAGGEGFVAAQDPGRASAGAGQKVQVREAVGDGPEADLALRGAQRSPGA
jgi:hypothetical protein